MNANLLSVTYYESGRRAVNFTCPGCGGLHEDFGWPDGGLKDGNVLGFVRCNHGCGTAFDVVIPAWARSPRHRMGYRKFLQPNQVFAGGDFGRDDNAMDDPANNWEE